MWCSSAKQEEACLTGKVSYFLSIFLWFKRQGKIIIKYLNVAKYHLGKVKLERVGQRSSPTAVRNLRGGPWGIAGLLVCSFASVALHCSFAC